MAAGKSPALKALFPFSLAVFAFAFALVLMEAIAVVVKVISVLTPIRAFQHTATTTRSGRTLHEIFILIFEYRYI